jgi:hypothetical protein
LEYLNEVLVDCGHPEAVMGSLGPWWTVVRQESLGDRTIPDAFFDGDEAAVRDFVRSQYDETEASAERDTEEFREFLRSRLSS